MCLLVLNIILNIKDDKIYRSFKFIVHYVQFKIWGSSLVSIDTYITSCSSPLEMTILSYFYVSCCM